MTIDSRAEIESAFAGFPSGVAALAADVSGAPVGLVSTSFTVGVSFEPPQVLFSVQRSSRTWPTLRRAERIGVSVLARGHEAVCMQLASRSRDRFAGLDITRGEGGALLVSDAAMWLECSLHNELDSGSHTLVILTVERVHVGDGAEPLVYHHRGFRDLARIASAESRGRAAVEAAA
ncbi:flavin reductase family protein [Microbacterium sp. 18062]|uniref:flavin reductase family protein n=1 Tax=Microbacterium sp. 18062 TaxID=2681410 RepID=UPI001F483F81|nr:flavin reductase family protein [Microbacterium sp. 18062]